MCINPIMWKPKSRTGFKTFKTDKPVLDQKPGSAINCVHQHFFLLGIHFDPRVYTFIKHLCQNETYHYIKATNLSFPLIQYWYVTHTMAIGQNSFAKVYMAVTQDLGQNATVLSWVPNVSQSRQSSYFALCMNFARPRKNVFSSTYHDA